MKHKRHPRSFFNTKQRTSMIVWYFILLIGILVLAWKMEDIISLFGV